MTLSQIGKLADTVLATEAGVITAQIVASPATYGLSLAQATEMADAATLFQEAIVAAENARNAAESATFDKDEQRQALVDVMSLYLNLMYATPSVTSAEIMTLGLEPRTTNKTPLIPSIPQSVLATPFADGTVKITWSRGENKYGMIYEVEVSDADESNWTVCATTTRQSVTLSGYEPGVPKWFRVRATKNGDYSDYSFNTGIYIPEPGLSLAA